MDKKTIVLLVLALAAIALVVKMLLFPGYKKAPFSPLATQTRVLPSQIMKTYTDPAGFTFNYPDNLSLTSEELTESGYADIKLTAKEVPGSLALKIADTKLSSLSSWLKSVSIATASATTAKIGKLPAYQIKKEQNIILGALDQGILFTIEIPQKDYWQKVAADVAADFTFAAPETNSVAVSDVVFEGEEAVE